MRIIQTAISVIAMVAAVAVSAQQKTTPPLEKQEPVIKIVEPVENSEAGFEVTVRGNARLEKGQYLWIVAREASFKPHWWPQREVEVDPRTGEWVGTAYLGQRRDIGKVFEIGVAAFDGKGHAALSNYIDQAMKSGNWKPILLPKTAMGPAVVKIRKTGHEE